MGKYITSEIEIAAPCADVWQCLTDFAAYPDWNPFIHKIEGKPGLGEALKADIQMANGKIMEFRPKLIEFEPQRKLTWLGHFLMSGLFDGRHEFELAQNQDGTTMFRQSEYFSGILVPLFGRGFDDKLRNSFQQMNKALKARVE